MSDKTDKTTTLEEVLRMIDARMAHIEDLTADNRSVIIKLVKQSNQLVKFIQQLQIEDITEDYLDDPLSKSVSVSIDSDKSDKFKHMKELVEEYMEKFEDLKEFEEELQKNKEDLTPGQIGEA
jgi:prefoldin subunit 5